MSHRRPVVVVLDDYEQAALRLADASAIQARADLHVHHEPLQGDALRAAVQPADVLVLMRDRTPLDAPLIEAMPHLRCVVFTGTRNAAIDFGALRRRAIPVSHTEWGPSKASTCELAWTLILAAAKRLPQAVQGLREGRWRDGGRLSEVLHGERLGLIGLGEIGGRMARVAGAFGMEVVTWSPNMTTERAAAQGAASVALDELLATSKVASLHLVLSESTRHLIDARRLALMRTDALLVNTSRAGLVDEDALIRALRDSRPGAAALDVFEHEPLPANHPLRTLSNVLLSPHLGFVSEPVFSRFYGDVTEAVLAWLTDQPLPRRLPDARGSLGRHSG